MYRTVNCQILVINTTFITVPNIQINNRPTQNVQILLVPLNQQRCDLNRVKKSISKEFSDWIHGKRRRGVPLFSCAGEAIFKIINTF